MKFHNVESKRYADIFIQKLIPCVASDSSISLTGCFGLVSPSLVQYWTESRVYTDYFSNSIGYDSFVTVYVTVNKIKKELSKSLITLTSEEEDGKYQLVDCDNEFKSYLKKIDHIQLLEMVFMV